ncbi:MAG TPA: DUF4105 domain-containing protein [Burkholderiales bacterium]
MLLPLPAAATPTYLDELVAKAREQRLAERPEWLKLLHYVPYAAWFGRRSLVDSPEFFNSPRGKRDPQAELEATLSGFFDPAEDTEQQQHPQCRFIARRAWLDAQLGFDGARLPPRECARYRAWYAALNPQALTLVFPSGFLNNPASMYGHTLLRIDSRDQDERTRLLAYSISFAAIAYERDGFVYPIKGLLGGYPGRFSMMPYYLKVREYSDLENRDVWEYQLAFSPEEIDRVLMHAWEMSPAWFDYYFFDENCSYQLNALLQVARPDLDLVSPFGWWALPSDTVRAVTRQPGLVKNVVFRPSNATIVQRRLDRLAAPERELVRELAAGHTGTGDPRLAALPPDRAAATVEAAYDLVNYRRATGKPEVTDPEALARGLLLARGSLDAPSQAPAAATPDTRPDEGHGTARFAFGAGRRASQDYQEIRARATYHDVMDDDAGYARGAQIEFFNMALRHLESGVTRVEEFTPIEIRSLSPRDAFFSPWSWHVSAGWRREFLADGSEPLVGSLQGGLGGAWSAAGGRVLAYAMADGRASQHHRLEDGYSLGAGGRLGAYVDPLPRWRVHAYARALGTFAGDHDTPRSAGIESRVSLARDLALRVDFSRSREHDRRYSTAMFSLFWYL